STCRTSATSSRRARFPGSRNCVTTSTSRSSSRRKASDQMRRMCADRANSPTLTPGLLAALGFVAMAGSLATDLYLPSFPSLQSDFGVTASVVQLTLTAFLVGAAVGQFVV